MLSIYPTLIDLCGVAARPELQGESLRPLLADPNAEWKRPAIATFGQNNHAVRSLHYRCIRYADGSQELCDHRQDPNEWTNLASYPAHAQALDPD